MENNFVKLPPKLIFLIPYRDRILQQEFFDRHMKTVILKDVPPEDYLLLYIHQCDQRSFNRGALKNIGFMAVKFLFPLHYKTITLVFNDVDTMPFRANQLSYATTRGIIKHFYGYDYALGGIVSIVGEDFEKVNGFPNFWQWGFEDNLLNRRVLAAGLKIDRSTFYHIMDATHFIQLKDGFQKAVNRTEFDSFIDGTREGISNLTNVTFDYDSQTGFVDVKSFETGRQEDVLNTSIFDMTKKVRPFDINKKKKRMYMRY